jgi:hypothetical protein
MVQGIKNSIHVGFTDIQPMVANANVTEWPKVNAVTSHNICLISAQVKMQVMANMNNKWSSACQFNIC